MVLQKQDEAFPDTLQRKPSVTKKAPGNFGITPMHFAALNPNTNYLKQLFEIAPEALQCDDDQQRKPVHFAAVCSSTAPLEFLASKGANLLVTDAQGRATIGCHV